jgi:ribosomal protein L4
VAGLFKQLGLEGRNVLVVGGKPDPVLYRSVRNIAGAACAPWNQINVYELLACEMVLVLKSALEGLKEVAA